VSSIAGEIGFSSLIPSLIDVGHIPFLRFLICPNCSERMHEGIGPISVGYSFVGVEQVSGMQVNGVFEVVDKVPESISITCAFGVMRLNEADDFVGSDE